MSLVFRSLQRLALPTTQLTGIFQRQTIQSIYACKTPQVIASSVNVNNTNRFSTTTGKPSTKEIEKLVKNKKLVVFMKGVPEEPRCGFSNAVVQVLRMHGVTSYESYDVLKDDGIRQGVKEYSNWPTIPQIYMNGEFIGGCDIFLEMHKNGELEQQFEKAGIEFSPVKTEAEK